MNDALEGFYRAAFRTKGENFDAAVTDLYCGKHELGPQYVGKCTKEYLPGFAHRDRTQVTSSAPSASDLVEHSSISIGHIWVRFHMDRRVEKPGPLLFPAKMESRGIGDRPLLVARGLRRPAHPSQTGATCGPAQRQYRQHTQCRGCGGLTADDTDVGVVRCAGLHLRNLVALPTVPPQTKRRPGDRIGAQTMETAIALSDRHALRRCQTGGLRRIRRRSE